MCDRDDSSLNNWLGRFDPDDPNSRDQVLRRGQDRVRMLVRRMLRGFPGVHRFNDTDDVLQRALMRMDRTLRGIPVPTAADFYCLAALQIRRELIDLAKKYRNLIDHYQTPTRDVHGHPLVPDEVTRTWEPDGLAVWENFHRSVDRLSEDQRKAFELLWYEGLTAGQAAKVRNVSEKTIRRRAAEAQACIVDAIDGKWPA